MPSTTPLRSICATAFISCREWGSIPSPLGEGAQLFDGADEQRVELAVTHLIDDERHPDLAWLPKVGRPDIPELLVGFQEGVFARETRDGRFEPFDVCDRRRASLL